MNRYRKIFHHIDIKDVKDRHLEEFLAIKLKQEKHIEEEKYITAEAEKLKVDWRKELEEEELKESDWTLTTSGNKVGATFQHASGGVLTVSSGLGGEDVHSTSQVTLDLGFGETITVDPPTYNELPLAGIPMPVSAAMPMHRQNTYKKAKEINKQLSASEKVAAKAKADALMKARIEEENKKKAHDEWVEKVEKLVEEAKEKHSEYVRQEQINIVAKAAKISKDDATKLYDNNYFIKGKTGISLFWDKQTIPHINYFKQSKPVEVEYESGKWKWTGKPKVAIRKIAWAPGGHSTTWWQEKDTGHRISSSQTLIDVGGGTTLVNAEFDMKKNGKDWSKVQGIWNYNDPTRRDADSLGYKVWQNFMPTLKEIEAKFGKQPQCDTCGDVGAANYWDLNRFQPEAIAAKAASYKAEADAMQRHYDNYQNKVSDDMKKIVEQDPEFMETVEENPEILSVLANHEDTIKGLSSDKITILDKAVGWHLRLLSLMPQINALSKSGAFAYGDWAIRYAQGDWRPITKSPGPAFDLVVKNLIKSNHIPGQLSGAIDNYGQYKYAGYPDMFWKATSSLTLGRFSYNITPNKDGTGTIDFGTEKFNFESLKSGGAGTNVGPLALFGIQQLANFLVNIGDKRSREKGIDPESGEGGIPIKIKIKLSKKEMEQILGSQKKTKGKSTPPPIKSKSTPQTKRQTKRQSLSLDEPLIIDKKKKKKKKVSESRVFDRIKKDFSYKGKPSPDGFPDTPPPKLKNGWHPEYGKVDNRYNRLDPISARSMPKTGEASIDKKVEKAKKKKK